MEIWKDIKNFEGFYQISNYGQVRSLDRKVWNYNKKGRVLKPHNNGAGYLEVSLSNNVTRCKHCYIHRLVASAFIPNPNNYSEVNHKDFNKANNHVDNLEWVSQEQNKLHYNLSLRKTRVLNERKNFLFNQAYSFIYENKDKILSLYDEGYTVKEIQKITNIGRDRVSAILRLYDRL